MNKQKLCSNGKPDSKKGKNGKENKNETRKECENEGGIATGGKYDRPHLHGFER